jgi:hypothetical protein
MEVHEAISSRTGWGMDISIDFSIETIQDIKSTILQAYATLAVKNERRDLTLKLSQSYVHNSAFPQTASQFPKPSYVPFFPEKVEQHKE